MMQISQDNKIKIIRLMMGIKMLNQNKMKDLELK